VHAVKISLITVTYNAESTISRCIESVIAQNYSNLEYIIIDGGSTDNTLQIISRYKNNINILITEPDHGIYDAMNKGIRMATSNVTGTLNADDFFASDDILANVAATFENTGADIVYGDLDYINSNETIRRKWRTKAYKNGFYNWGWMPPHPTFYCKTALFEKYGYYSLEHGTAADYELMLRFMHRNNAKAAYLNKVMIKMQCGGMSNKNPTNRVKAWRNDLKAMRSNGVLYPLIALILKPLRKIGQYLS
jgi:glycosyltransferase involved in cell wall biosynthesis